MGPTNEQFTPYNVGPTNEQFSRFNKFSRS